MFENRLLGPAGIRRGGRRGHTVFHKVWALSAFLGFCSGELSTASFRSQPPVPPQPLTKAPPARPHQRLVRRHGRPSPRGVLGRGRQQQRDAGGCPRRLQRVLIWAAAGGVRERVRVRGADKRPHAPRRLRGGARPPPAAGTRGATGRTPGHRRTLRLPGALNARRFACRSDGRGRTSSPLPGPRGVACPAPCSPASPRPSLGPRPLLGGLGARLPQADGGGSRGKVSLGLKPKGGGLPVCGLRPLLETPPRHQPTSGVRVPGASRPQCGSAKDSREEPARKTQRGDSWCLVGGLNREPAVPSRAPRQLEVTRPPNPLPD